MHDFLVIMVSNLSNINLKIVPRKQNLRINRTNIRITYNRQYQPLNENFFRKIAGALLLHCSRKQIIYNLGNRKKKKIMHKSTNMCGSHSGPPFFDLVHISQLRDHQLIMYHHQIPHFFCIWALGHKVHCWFIHCLTQLTEQIQLSSSPDDTLRSKLM